MSFLKKNLKEKKVTIGTWLTIPRQEIVEIFANAGFEWVTIDIEHSAIDYGDVLNLIGHIQGNGMEALVRVSGNNEAEIKKVMDAGANGVIVPMIKTKEEIENAISYVKYPPMGKRGVGLSRAQKYGFGFDKYKDWVKKESVVIAQIEHIDAVKNLESILSVSDLDGIIIGPYDLSASTGFPGEYNKPIVLEALNKITKLTLESDKSLGFHVIEPEANEILKKIELSYNFIAFSVDFIFLDHTIREQMQKFRIKLNNN